MSDHNIILMSFSEPSKAYQALSELKGAGWENRLELRAAGVITRDEQGQLNIAEGGDFVGGVRTWGGSLIGLLIGVLGGPIGMLFGWTGGLLVGGAFDHRRARRATGVLAEISTFIPNNGTVVVAEVEEHAVEVLDSLAAELDGEVFRRPAEEVLAELEATQEAYDHAQREADRLAKADRKTERRQNFEERKNALKEKLGLS